MNLNLGSVVAIIRYLVARHQQSSKSFFPTDDDDDEGRGVSFIAFFTHFRLSLGLHKRA